jgi:hypothetical protein
MDLIVNNYLAGAGYYNRFNAKKGQSVNIRAGRFIRQFNSHEPVGDPMNAGYTLFDKSNFKNYMLNMQSKLTTIMK